MNDLKVRNSDEEGIAILIPGTATGTINVSLWTDDGQRDTDDPALIDEPETW